VAEADLGEGTRLAADSGAWICFEDEAGQTLRPPRARTWGQRGHTPVVAVSGKGSGRVSIAGLVAYQPGRRAHLYYRLAVHRGRKGERRSLSEADYAALLSAAHHQLHAPIIVIWDNLNTHISTVMRRFIDAHHDWLTVVRLPAYAPDLNAAESIWSHLKHGLGNLAATGIDHLTTIVKTRLKRIQYHPELLDGFLAQTGFTLQPLPP
jgi:transposase